MSARKNASLDALFSEGSAPLSSVEKSPIKGKTPAKKQKTAKSTSSKKATDANEKVNVPSKNTTRSRGRPVEFKAKRQQIPVTLPEPVYFELLDWVNLRKRDNKRFCMNEIILEALDVWLAAQGKPSIEELTNK